MRKRRLIVALAFLGLCCAVTSASADETQIRVGNLDAFLTTPPGVEKPPVALLIAGSGSTDHDGNGPRAKPATLKKLSEQLAAQKIATLRYDKRGAGGWKPEFGKPEDFRFKDYVDDAASLVNYLRASGKYSSVAVVGHSEGGLVAILAARQVQIDRLVLLVTAARRQGDLVKAQLEKRQIPPDILDPIANAIDSIMAGRTVDPPPRGFDVPPSMQPSLASAFVIDPIDPLKAIDEPILIVGGGHDLQVARLDFFALATAAPLAKTLWQPEMNHVLVDVTDDADNLAAYNQPERALDAKMVEAVAAFIQSEDRR
ncbi:alpha/beta fold hydrolase [Bradyrhizobium sp.]|uniref:alpha/beta hydrolase family protein n=1 Tax=Bradyrhizobium sp. TaxID=376 RepID=UPI0026127CD0|nr:alpha/beta fold hydrolase [Bradyrhizobium sp.]